MAGENDQLNVDFGDDDGDNEIVVSLQVEDGAVKVKKTEEPKKKADEGGDDPLESLKTQFATMSQRATNLEQQVANAQQEAQQATQRAQHLEQQVVGSQLDTVVTGLDAATAEADAAEREYAVAFEAGDGMAMARAQRKMANAEARKLTLEGAKADLEAESKRRPDPSKQPQRRAQPSADPTERFLQERNIKGQSADWVRRHPQMITDAAFNDRIMKAHWQAQADGVEVESEEYFQRLDKAVSGTVVKKSGADPEPSKRRPSAPAAGDSNAGGGSQLNGGGIDVTLTKREAKSATDGTLVWNYDDPSGQKKFKKGDPIGLAEMARRKHFGMKAGLYDKSLME